MIFHTLQISSSINFTNSILDSGSTPSVISAIMKQKTTEMGRKVINDAIKRALGESSLTINMTTVLLTSVVLVLICVLFELGTLNHRLTKKEKSKILSKIKSLF